MPIDALADWWVHPVTVLRYLGTSGYGKDIYAPPAVVTGFVDARRRNVIDGNGDTIISEATLALPKSVELIPLKSKITLPSALGGRTATVLAAAIGDTGGLLAAVEHAEYALT